MASIIISHVTVAWLCLRVLGKFVESKNELLAPPPAHRLVQSRVQEVAMGRANE